MLIKKWVFISNIDIRVAAPYLQGLQRNKIEND